MSDGYTEPLVVFLQKERQARSALLRESGEDFFFFWRPPLSRTAECTNNWSFFEGLAGYVQALPSLAPKSGLSSQEQGWCCSKQ